MDNLAHTVNDLVQTVSIYALPVLFAITLHEAAHGYVARHFGDMTAHAERRISLNPLRHVELLGTVIVPLLILYFSSWKFVFGWAKPVPVNYSALREPRRVSMGFVAAAGPAANLLMLLCWAIVLRFWPVGTIGAILAGWHAKGLPSYSLGYVDLIIFAAMIPAVMIAAPIGVRTGHTLSEAWLRRTFTVLLFIIAADLIAKLMHW